jgi:uncharacterized protein YfaS (alpha-2-macroglobulin family)
MPSRFLNGGLILKALSVAVAAVLCVLLYAGPQLINQDTKTKEPAGKQPQKAGPWGEVDRLISEQKFAEALTRVEQIRGTAEKARNEPDWTRALIREVQLRIALHQYETAVKSFKEHPWPQGFPQRAALNLFYAQSLVTYYQSYSWEVNQREKVQSSVAADLKAWTRDQIYAEAQKAYQTLWEQRAALGNEPVSVLAEYVQPNNYPAGIRSTLRDAVSYLYISLLADTTFWRPEESNEIYRLNLKALLGAPPKTVALADAAVHPILKIQAILGDLEAWHAGNGRREAALEARLELLRRLHASFSQAEDRAAIEGALQTLLPRYRDVSWWAMGMATMAEFTGAQDQAGKLIRVRRIADEGYRAFPESVGGKRCLFMLRQVEAPDFQITSMSTDGSQKRSIEVTHKNLRALYFRAYDTRLSQRLEKGESLDLALDQRTQMTLLRSGEWAAEWQVELPPTPDYEMHRTFVTPPLKTPGAYVIFASAQKDFGESQKNRVLSVQLNISGLVLTTEWETPSSLVIRTVSGETGRPLAGVNVSLYRYNYRARHQKVLDRVSDDDGAARFPFEGKVSEGNYFLFARRGSDVALLTNYLRFSAESPAARTASLIYTDRSIYRPMQKILWKVLVYREERGGGTFRTLPSNLVTVSLMDPNGQKVDSRVVSTNSFGTAAGEFNIPTGRMLGGWRIESSLSGNAVVRVEEYKRPTFEVTLKDPASPLRLNKPATLRGEVKYYFGLPVVNGSVKWRVSRVPVYPWWWRRFVYVYRGGSGSAQIVAIGTAFLKEDGSFSVTFTPEADEREAKESREITYSYQLTADVTDEGGETRSASMRFRLGFVSIEAQLEMGAGFFRDGIAGAVRVVRTSLDGAPRPGRGSWRVVSLKQPPAAALPADLPPLNSGGKTSDSYRTPGDLLRARWDSGYTHQEILRSWADDSEKSRGSATHGDNGKAEISLPGLPSGAYRFYYETFDDFGAPYRTSTEFIVAGEKTTLALPALLLAERTSAAPGDTARFLALSGLPNQLLTLEVWRDGRLSESRKLVSQQDSTLIEIPVKESDRGGFAVRLSTLRDYQLLQLNASLFVPWDNKKLNIELSTFRDKIHPGEKETWRVTVKDPSGANVEAGAAELLAYMYDKSLDLFAPHNPPDPLRIYPTKARSQPLNSNLGSAYCQYLLNNLFTLPAYPQLEWDRVKLYEGLGIGGPGRRPFGFGRGAGVGGARVITEAAAPAGIPAPAPQALSENGVIEAGKLQVLDQAVTAAEPRPEPEAPAAMRSDFSETAFWQAQLLTDSQGSATIEFKVPDSVTAWNVWIHAVTRDLLSASLHEETRSFKDLMVRPYLPRFLREGDQAQLKVVVNNASDHELKGDVTLEVFDPDTNQSLRDRFGLSADAVRHGFAVAASSGASVTFSVKAPASVGTVAFRVAAAAGATSDGELRSLPILPGRMHLAQSRFVALRDKDRRELAFDDLKQGGDPTLINERMVVTLDAQLFYSVLSALPYLINYPYECTEQTLNRFVSTGILASLYGKYPAVARVAGEMSKRATVLETFDTADPNRKMALEETPWLVEAKGGNAPDSGMTNVLNPDITRAERDAALAKLRKTQTAGGGFPWWPGGPPSPYMTLYIMYGFAKAAEFGVDVPRDMVQQGWSYLARQVREDFLARMLKEDCCWEFLTYLNYVATCYPDPSWMGEALTPQERQAILDHCFKHWKQHSPYLKCQLALTLKRMGRPADASLVFASVMDSARTTRDEGTFWAPEDRSWLWYNDTIETHAFALRTMMELAPQDSRKDGLVQWLFLNKKLNHWKSTRATAEVLYSIAHYLRQEGTLGAREDATVRVGSQTVQYVFEPDQYTGGKNQTVIPGEKIGPGSSPVVVEKEGKGFLFASATWQFSTEKLPEREQGDLLSVSRSYFKRERTGREDVLRPLAEGAALTTGDEIEVHLAVRAKHPCEYIHLRDPRAAGLEPESAVSRYRWDQGIGWYEEIRDSGTNFFFEGMPQGEYTLKYRLRANMAGAFRIGPATIQSMYAPEFNAYSTGAQLTIEEPHKP